MCWQILRVFVDHSNRNWQSNLTHDDFNEDYGQVWGVDRDETTRRAQQLHDPALFLLSHPISMHWRPFLN